MLNTLRIKNLALVPDLTLELTSGYNAITGETGAGKSVIMGALNLVLGERADRSLIRSGADSCSVEAVFNITALEKRIGPLIEEKGLEPCEDGQLVLKRTFTTSGVNKQFVNGSPATLAILAGLGQWLVDMHGPHDHQSLLHAGRQLEILDAYAGLEANREKFAELVRARSDLLGQKATLVIDERTYAQQLDLLRFQSNEIAAAKLRPEEEDALEAEHSRASNAARLTELTQGSIAALTGEEDSLLDKAGIIGRSLQELSRLDPQAQPLVELHDQAISTLQELQRELSHYADALETDPARLQELETRLDLLHSLKRKYGASIEEVIAFGNDAAQKLYSLESRDEELLRLKAEIEKTERSLWAAGLELTAARKKVIPKLAKVVARQLNDLGFKQSLFDVEIRTLNKERSFAEEQIQSTGLDSIEFQFAPNPGEPARPLKAIASSGELARVMLALKTVLAVQDEVPVLVFDEVDANVGGETATAVGMKMSQIGAQRQVLCITHLAQVAAAAGTHFVVTKETRDGRTVSTIQPITGKARVSELTRMLGGGEAARNHAEAMLAAAKQ